MKLISVNDCATALGCTTMQVYRLLAAGYLHSLRSGRRHYVPADELSTFIATHQHDGMVDTSLDYARLVADQCH